MSQEKSVLSKSGPPGPFVEETINCSSQDLRVYRVEELGFRI